MPGRWEPALLADGFFDVVEVQGRLAVAAAPVFGVDAGADPAVKARPWPVFRAADVAVFDRVPVDVVEVTLEIVFVPDRVLPELRLPDSASAVALSALCDSDLGPAEFEPALSELRLDPLPAAGVVRVAFWHAPDCVDVLGQEHDRANVERVRRLTFADDVAEDRPGVFGFEDRTTVVSDQREEECPAGDMCSSPIWHSRKRTFIAAAIRA
jgi:hypothetical protein